MMVIFYVILLTISTVYLAGIVTKWIQLAT